MIHTVPDRPDNEPDEDLPITIGNALSVPRGTVTYGSKFTAQDWARIQEYCWLWGTESGNMHAKRIAQRIKAGDR